MNVNTDNTARIVVLSLCVCIVIMRLLRPDLPFDACSLGALALAALVAVLPTVTSACAKARPRELRAGEVEALRASAESAGLLIAESSGAYAALRALRPVTAALAGARATLALRLRALPARARLDAHGDDMEHCLVALHGAGVTTDEQHSALSELERLLALGAQAESPANDALLELAIGVIEMLDGTLE